MKNSGSLIKILTAGTIALAIVLVAGFASSALAQEKGATKLLQSKSGAAATGETAAMSCSKCKDSTVTITEKPARTGAKASSHTVTRHECPGCQNALTTTGHGKAATSTVKHTCSLAATEGAACCAKR